VKAAGTDWGQHMLVLLSGRALVRRGEQELATVGPGDAVGAMSLLDGLPRSASVVGAEPLEALVLYRTAFKRLLGEQASMCEKLLLG
jgi:CRP/FNR family transcriptional regulator, cyclic AMP receptor protein